MPEKNTSFAQYIVQTHGEQGRAWLKALPNLLARLAQHWQVSDLMLVPEISYNYTVSGVQNKKSVIIKIGHGHDQVLAEAEALRAFAGHGIVQLIDHDIQSGALLLERIEPGIPLNRLFPEQDQQASVVMCHVMSKLHQAPIPAQHAFKPLAQLLAILTIDWAIPGNYLLRARAFSKQLLTTTNRQVLLHGDLHHGNILMAGDGHWVAIDPKGLIGDPLYDACVSIYNPIPTLLDNPHAATIVRDRLHSYAEHIACDRERLFAWVYVQTAMAACWAIEDTLDAAYFISMLHLLETLS